MFLIFDNEKNFACLFLKKNCISKNIVINYVYTLSRQRVARLPAAKINVGGSAALRMGRAPRGHNAASRRRCPEKPC